MIVGKIYKNTLTKLIYTLFLSFISFGFVSAQDVKQTFYQGKVGDKAVRFYLKQLPNNCGGPDMYEAIYQYGKGKNWIELLNQTNEKGDFCFTEIRFTGVLILKKTVNALEGIWMSTDGKTQLKVKLTQKSVSKLELEELEERLEKTHYENFDC